MINKQT